MAVARRYRRGRGLYRRPGLVRNRGGRAMVGMLGVDAHGVNRTVDADPSGQFDNGLHRVLSFEIDDFRSLPLRHH